jgi:hypothetical protein
MKRLATGVVVLLLLTGVAVALLSIRSGTPAPRATPTPRPTRTETPPPTATDLPTPTPTLVPIPTPTPLPTPRLPSTDKPDGPPRVSDARVAGGPFYPYDRERRCPQNTLIVRAKITDANGIAEAVVAYRFVTETSDRATEFRFTTMTYVGEDTYVQTFAPFPRTGYFEYNVLARDLQGETGRSGFLLPVQIQLCLPLTMPTLAIPTVR